jgi:hypothetical protein
MGHSISTQHIRESKLHVDMSATITVSLPNKREHPHMLMDDA